MNSLIFLVLSFSLLFVAPITARVKQYQANSPSPFASPAPGPSNSDCSNVIYDMMDCLSYLSPGSNDTKPGQACCVGIRSVMQYNPHCICVGLATSNDMGIALNTTRALASPSTCNIPIAAPHCAMPGSSAPVTSTPVAPSAKTSPATSQTSVGAPRSSPSLTESPSPSPSHSGTNNLSVSTLTFFAVSSLIYISALAF
ncbi:unnamed protein product [Cochlearia groenlandica]